MDPSSGSRWGEGSMALLMKGTHTGLIGQPIRRETIKIALKHRPKAVDTQSATGQDVFTRLYSGHRKHCEARSVKDLQCLLGRADPNLLTAEDLQAFEWISATPITARSLRPAPPSRPQSTQRLSYSLSRPQSAGSLSLSQIRTRPPSAGPLPATEASKAAARRVARVAARKAAERRAAERAERAAVTGVGSRRPASAATTTTRLHHTRGSGSRMVRCGACGELFGVLAGTTVAVCAHCGAHNQRPPPAVRAPTSPRSTLNPAPATAGLNHARRAAEPAVVKARVVGRYYALTLFSGSSDPACGFALLHS